jgi:hypothetical protein
VSEKEKSAVEEMKKKERKEKMTVVLSQHRRGRGRRLRV